MILDFAARLLCGCCRAETAHRGHLATDAALSAPLLPGAPRRRSAARRRRRWACPFPIPSGWRRASTRMRDVPDAMLKLGFGFVECGTVTPSPQAGNPRPRLFRLREDRAVINRMGFNNGGMEAAARNLVARRRRGHRRHQYRRQQGQRRPHRRLRARLRAAGAAGRLCDGQCLLAQHAGPARAAEPGRTDPAC